MAKEMREAATCASISSREMAKEISNLRALNETLTSAAVRDKLTLLDAQQNVAKLTEEIEEIRNEMLSDTDESNESCEECESEAEHPEHPSEPDETETPDDRPGDQKVRASDLRRNL